MATTYITGCSPTQAWGKICDLIFSGNGRMRLVRPNVIVTDGVPDDSLPIGTWCLDITNSDVYHAQDAAGTWTKLTA